MTYTPTQLEVIRVFGKQEWIHGELMGESIPHLEDVFRVAKDRKMFYGIKGEYVKEKEFEYIEYLWFSNMDIGEKCIPYNPTIPLLEQPESVLIELLNLFK